MGTHRVREMSPSSCRRPLLVKDGPREEMLIHVAPITFPFHNPLRDLQWHGFLHSHLDCGTLNYRRKASIPLSPSTSYRCGLRTARCTPDRTRLSKAHHVFEGHFSSSIITSRFALHGYKFHLCLRVREPGPYVGWILGGNYSL